MIGTIGDRIRVWRGEKNLSIPELAQKSGVRPQVMIDLLTNALDVARRTGCMQATFDAGQIAHAYPDGRVERFPIPRGFLDPFGPGLGETRHGTGGAPWW